MKIKMRTLVKKKGGWALIISSVNQNEVQIMIWILKL